MTVAELPMAVPAAAPAPEATPRGLAMICYSGELEKTWAAMILASTAGAMGMPTDPTATWEDCYAPQAPKFTPICPRYPKDAVLDKSFTGKNLGTKRIIRGGAYISASASGLNSDLVANCFGRSDARVLAKGPQDDPLVFVGFRCAQNVK